MPLPVQWPLTCSLQWLLTIYRTIDFHSLKSETLYSITAARFQLPSPSFTKYSTSQFESPLWVPPPPCHRYGLGTCFPFPPWLEGTAWPFRKLPPSLQSDFHPPSLVKLPLSPAPQPIKPLLTSPLQDELCSLTSHTIFTSLSPILYTHVCCHFSLGITFLALLIKNYFFGTTDSQGVAERVWSPESPSPAPPEVAILCGHGAFQNQETDVVT